ncbi:MAG: chaperone NapD [Thiotrichaceae bacterium]|nr:chaperone NapD [Thiotrichaceae bacterium]
MTDNNKTPETISICGVMAQVLPERMAEVEPEMLAIPGLEIHKISDDGKVVITVESGSYRDTGDRISALQKLKGVLSASMIYQHTETLEDEA